ncbi:uncharacterized protein [Eleutherodactylus coqui]|uniref:uncharacterized protein n=1 Tax=Eleutherodactylus coqui TaxID=57060 RepID=UPI00346316B4
MDNAELRQYILNFSLDDGPHSNQGYNRVLLQLFGYAGHGKSSFINSCKYIIDDGEKFKEHAEPENIQSKGGKTMIREAYVLTKSITIVDNRGFSATDSFQRAEIYAQLGNFIPIGEKVTWTDNYIAMMNRLEDAELNPNYFDFIVPILIYSADYDLKGTQREELKTFLENCERMTGIFPIIVISKKESGVVKNIKKMFNLMGSKVIIPIENFTMEDHDKTQGKTEKILTIIHKALEEVRSRLREKRNSVDDRVQQKKFLLEYIYNADQEKKEKQWRIEEINRRDEEMRKEKSGSCRIL